CVCVCVCVCVGREWRVGSLARTANTALALLSGLSGAQAPHVLFQLHQTQQPQTHTHTQNTHCTRVTKTVLTDASFFLFVCRSTLESRLSCALKNNSTSSNFRLWKTPLLCSTLQHSSLCSCNCARK